MQMVYKLYLHWKYFFKFLPEHHPRFYWKSFGLPTGKARGTAEVSPSGTQPLAGTPLLLGHNPGMSMLRLSSMKWGTRLTPLFY